MRMDQRLSTGVLMGGLLLLLLLVLAGGAAGGWMLAKGLAQPGTVAIADTPTLLRQVQAMNELVGVKYVLEKVVVVEDSKWYGDSRLLMVAHGVAKAGVDLGRMQPEDIRRRGDSIHVTLPRPRVLDVYLDDRRTQVIERSTGVMRTFDKDLEQDARRQAVDQIKVAVRDSGILREAEDRARLQLEGLLVRAGFREVEVSFR